MRVAAGVSVTIGVDEAGGSNVRLGITDAVGASVIVGSGVFVGVFVLVGVKVDVRSALTRAGWTVNCAIIPMMMSEPQIQPSETPATNPTKI